MNKVKISESELKNIVRKVIREELSSGDLKRAIEDTGATVLGMEVTRGNVMIGIEHQGNEMSFHINPKNGRAELSERWNNGLAGGFGGERNVDVSSPRALAKDLVELVTQKDAIRFM